MIDVGEALAQDQMDEYREAARQEQEGRPSVRLLWASRASLVIVAAAICAILSTAHWR